MERRLELHEILCGFLGSRNVYYQPPESKKMEYDAIRYSLRNIDSQFANNSRYKTMNRYELLLITQKPDPEVLTKILELPYSSLDRVYVSDNLYHYPITLYF